VGENCIKRLVITDSGLGGLNVVASLYENLKNISLIKPLDLIFVNALPDNGRGYNTMPDIASKVQMFNRVLIGIENHFSPDLIGIACNTLSVIVDQTEYYTQHQEKILGIVESGIKSLLNNREINKSSCFIIFGTETTIELDRHRQLLMESGIAENKIIPQICSGLASAIEDNPQGKRTRQIVYESVKQATSIIDSHDNHITLYLACTHYGYVRDIFEEYIKKEGFTNSETFDPNQSMTEIIFNLTNTPLSKSYSNPSHINLCIYSRCNIPDHEINSIARLLRHLSSDTARVLAEYKLVPGLFIPF
jgi:glutamate racemase